MNDQAAVVLLSGGQDSTTCLYWAKRYYREVHAVSIFYGQRHAAELVAAEKIAAGAGATWRKFELGVLAELADSALVDPARAVGVAGAYSDMGAAGALPASFVPGRNALLLAVAASYAVKLGAPHIVTGVCQTDYSGYPDCREEFVTAMEAALSLAMPSSTRPLRIHTPLMRLSKVQTVKLARTLPGCWEALGQSLTCYEGRRPACGACPACVLRAKGFAEAGETDPAEGP